MFKDAAFDVFRFYRFYGNNVVFVGSEIRVTGYEVRGASCGIRVMRFTVYPLHSFTRLTRNSSHSSTKILDR